MIEDINWKLIIDDLQPGFILFKKNMIFYRNEAANQLFGLPKN
jgi:hypothetical protein